MPIYDCGCSREPMQDGEKQRDVSEGTKERNSKGRENSERKEKKRKKDKKQKTKDQG